MKREPLGHPRLWSPTLLYLVFHWKLSDSKSPQVSRTLLSILVDLNSTVIWIVSILPLISNSSSYLFKPILIDITVSLIFHSFLNSLDRSKYLNRFSLSFILSAWSSGTSRSTWQQGLFFSLISSRSGLLDYYHYYYICLSVCLLSHLGHLCFQLSSYINLKNKKGIFAQNIYCCLWYHHSVLTGPFYSLLLL